MKIVLDTNVLISSFFDGNPRKIFDLWKSGTITLCLSRPIVDEYVEVIMRMGLRDEEQLQKLLRLFAQGPHVVYTATTPELAIVNSDPDDNKFIECAVALDGRFIVSGDNHLLSLKEYMGIRIVSPKEFLNEIS